MMVSVHNILSLLDFEKNDTSKSNPPPGKDLAIVSSLAQTKIVSVGYPTDRNSMPSAVVVIHSNSNHTATSLLVQIIQAACDKIFGSVENRNTSSSPEKLILSIDLSALKELEPSPPNPSQEATSPPPDWGLYDPDTSKFQKLDSPTTPYLRKLFNSQQNNPPPLKKTPKTHNLLAPIARYPEQNPQNNETLNNG